jgi:hypothetical protein
VIVFCISVCGIWLSLIYHTFITDINLLNYEHPDDFKLPSYLLSKKDYLQYSDSYYGSLLPENEDFSNYPKLFPLSTLFDIWPSNNVSKSAWKSSITHPSKPQNALYRFDYQNQTERKIASKLLNLELPFIIYNVPELDLAAQKEFTIMNMFSHFGTIPRFVERSLHQNQFLYYTAKNPLLISQRFPQWSAPQQDILIQFPKFLGEAEEAEICDNEVGKRTLSYMTISANEVTIEI